MALDDFDRALMAATDQAAREIGAWLETLPPAP